MLTRLQKNPQLRTLSRRHELETQQLDDMTNPETRQKRSWVDVGTIREILRLRDISKWPPEKIERELGLAPGVVKRLGPHVRDV